MPVVMISGLPIMLLMMILELLLVKVSVDCLRCLLVLAAMVAALDFVFSILDVMMMVVVCGSSVEVSLGPCLIFGMPEPVEEPVVDDHSKS